MDLHKHLKTWKGTITENRFNRGVILFLILSNIILGVMLFKQETTVVLTPAVVNKDLEVSANDASAEYLKAFSWSLAMQLGNITPSNVETVKEMISPILDPSIYRETIAAIESQKLEFQRDRISQTFDPRAMIFEKKTKKVFVSGTSTIAGPSGAPRKDQRVYELEWRIEGYRPFLVFLTTYTGDPRTERVLRRHDDQAAKRDQAEKQ